MVVGPQDQRFYNDVGALQRISAFQNLCQQRKNAADFCLSRNNLFCILSVHISANIYCPGNSFSGAAMKIRNYDYYLIILTVLILSGIGLVSLYGISYYNYLAVDPQWTATDQYSRYVGEMDSYLYPFLILLLILLGMCIPKRLFGQDLLIKFSTIILGITVGLIFLYDIGTGMGFILFSMMFVQIIVLIMTIRKNKSIRFEKEGYLTGIGSSLLHLGYVIIILNFISLKDSPFHMLFFWMGLILITSGNILSFYPDKIASLFPGI